MDDIFIEIVHNQLLLDIILKKLGFSDKELDKINTDINKTIKENFEKYNIKCGEGEDK